MTATHDERFFSGIEQVTVPTSAGPCAMPILYRDASLLGLFYRVPIARAAALLPAGGPFEVFPVFGKGVVLLVVFEYRDTSVGPYGELGLAVLGKRAGTRPGLLRFMRDMKTQEDTGLYVVNLPVTTQAAFAAGVELWGYPKYVTGITSEFSESGVRSVLAGELEITAGRGRGLKTAGLPFCTFTLQGDTILRTVVEVGHKARWGGSGSARLQVIGDGPTARSVEALGLAGARASFMFRTDAMRAILPFGKAVGHVAEAPDQPAAA